MTRSASIINVWIVEIGCIVLYVLSVLCTCVLTCTILTRRLAKITTYAILCLKNYNICTLLLWKPRGGGRRWGGGGFLTTFLWIYTMSTDIFYCHLVFDFSKMNDSSFGHQIFRCIFFKKLCEFIFGGRFSDYQEEIYPSALLRAEGSRLQTGLFQFCRGGS